MISIHTLGFSRMGAHRELKFALERHWRGEITATQLENVGRELRSAHWQLQRECGLDYVTVGDFAFYDHVANHIQMLGCEPPRFGFHDDDHELARYFTLARGIASEKNGSSSGKPALEMTKWFDSNYHYLVPEFLPDTEFSLASERLFDETEEAQALGHRVKAVLIGPLTFLWLGKEKNATFDRLNLLDRLLPVYGQILERLQALGVEWVQIDEPILGLDLPSTWRNLFEPTYSRLAAADIPLLLTSYFSSLEENLRLACHLPVAGLHIDAVRAPEELAAIADWLPAHKILSVGIVDGRNIWRTDLDAALALLKTIYRRRHKQLWLAPSCSLLHVPFSLANENKLDDELLSWLAFGIEKLQELDTLKLALKNPLAAEQALAQARQPVQSRRTSARINNPAVAQRLATLPSDADCRHATFAIRQAAQRERFRLPLLPTTTIGSFPQTATIRGARAALRRGELGTSEYQNIIKQEIAHTIAIQEQLGLDVLVHGEAERNDMVEYFGEQLAGFCFTENGWVQSYGSRCVKPPIIYGDVFRPGPVTTAWATYAQSLTEKPVKGMLTGPVTLLQWSFVRDDRPRSSTARQIALAIRDEVMDLEAAGIGIIQIDEPALREGLPLRHADRREYLAWATHAFRLSASGVANQTQIHSHMCYSEFNDILPDIATMDVDVITIETSRSDMELLDAFGKFSYPNEIGPGVYDIHSPRVPEVSEMIHLLRKALETIPADHLWANPDCGLKTRGWPETKAALRNLVEAAQLMRTEITQNNR